MPFLAASVQRAAIREPLIVIDDAFKNLLRVDVVLVAHRQPVVAGVRDLEDECLPPVLRAGAHLVHDHRVRVLVNLIDQRHVNALAVECPRLGGDRPEVRLRTGMRDVVDGELQLLRQVGGTLPHLLGVGKQDLRLVPRHRRRVYLGARLVVHRQAIEADACRERALATALPGFDVGRAESSIAVRRLPPEQ